MNQQYTGYYINESGEIVCEHGLTLSYVHNNRIFKFDGAETGYTISGKIIRENGSPTGYFIVESSIFGPFKFLPWLR